MHKRARGSHWPDELRERIPSRSAGSRDLPDTLAQMFDRNTEQRPDWRETRGHDGAIAALGD